MKTNSKIPQVMSTKNYDRFEMHRCNRPIHKNDPVEASMRRVGFMPSSPLQCIKNGNGKLKIVRGHHRFSIAKKLSIPVKYMVDDSNTDIFELEGSSTGAWNSPDFAFARAQAGDKDIQFMLTFKEEHGFTLGSAASLVYGQSAGSGNALRVIKTGRFKIGDMTHANKVAAITDVLRDEKIEFATSAGFVSAISSAVRIPELDYDILMHKARTRSYILSKRSTAKEYLQEIEELYNYAAKRKGKRLSVSYRADEVGRDRAAIGNKA